MRKLALIFIIFSGDAYSQIDDRGYPATGARSVDDYTFGQRESVLTSDLDIPAVIERTHSPSIEVTEFNFDNLPEYPHLGISKQHVEVLAENLRLKVIRKKAERFSGFTEQELNEFAQLLPVNTNATVDIVLMDVERIVEFLLFTYGKQKIINIVYYEVEALVELIRKLPMASWVNESLIDQDLVSELVNLINKQRSDRGFSYEEINEVASEITRFYRQRGLFLAKTYIPVQTVTDGVVKLSVMEGRLGDVTVEGNKRYSKERIAAVLTPYIDKVVNNSEMEEAIYLINSNPGINVYGYFSEGEKIGETALNIQVVKEEALQVKVSVDNHGSIFTGDNRLFTFVDWFNPTGRGDVLSLGFLKSWNPLNSQVGIFQYRTPLWNNRAHLVVGADFNEFTIDGKDDATVEALAISGSSTVYTVGVDYQIRRLRTLGLNVGVSFTEKNTEITAVQKLPDSGELVQGLQFNMGFDVLNEEWRIFLMGQMSINYGGFIEGVDRAFNQDEQFYKFSLDMSTLKYFELPFTNIESRFILKSKLRYSKEDLPAFEQLPLGGIDTVKAFTVSDFSADQAAYLGAQWNIEFPELLNIEFYGGSTLNQVVDFGLFIDGAYGVSNVNIPSATDSWMHLAGAGVVMEFSWKEKFNAKISLAQPIANKSSSTRDDFSDDADSVRAFVEFSYVY